MSFKALLVVGRVSNLPTIWTNVVAATLVAQTSLSTAGAPEFAERSLWLWLGVSLALSLMYLGGMFLNDAFDADWDRQNNNPRPIVLGDIGLSTVWIVGSGLMISAVILIAGLYYQSGQLESLDQPEHSLLGLMVGLLLALTIITYNVWHKRFAHSAVIMGACRLGVYLTSALLLAQVTPQVMMAGLSLLLYITGITYLARHEHLNQIIRLWPLLLLFSPVVLALYWGFEQLFCWLFASGCVTWLVSRLRLVVGVSEPNVRACIGGLLAAIPLLDGLMLASVGAWLPSLLCGLVFLLIPRLHYWVSGT